jgi:hypothetical protein
MSHIKQIVLVGLFLLMPINLASAAPQNFPERFSGDLKVCSKVSEGMKGGKSLESSLVDFFLSFSDQPTVQSYQSIQRAIVYDSVKSCHFNGADVVHSALRIDMSQPLLVLSLNDAGVNPQTIQDVLQQSGLNPDAIHIAFVEAGLTGQIPTASYALSLLPPFDESATTGEPGTDTGGGLGQASPFMP